MPTRRAKKLTAFHFEKAGWLGEFEQGSAPRKTVTVVVEGGSTSTSTDQQNQEQEQQHDPFRKWLPLHRLMRQRRSGSSERVYLTVEVHIGRRRMRSNSLANAAVEEPAAAAYGHDKLAPDPDDREFDEFDIFYGDIASYFGLTVVEKVEEGSVSAHKDFAFSLEHGDGAEEGGSNTGTGGLEAVYFTVQGKSVITADKLAQLREVMINDFLHSRLLNSAPSQIQRCRTLPRDQNELQVMYSSNQM